MIDAPSLMILKRWKFCDRRRFGFIQDRLRHCLQRPPAWPFEIGCVLVREMRHLRQAFAVHPEDNASYLADVGRMAEREVVFYEHGVQLTRSFRALKLWMSLRIYGLEAFRATIDRGIALAEEAEQMLRADPRWEVVTPAHRTGAAPKTSLTLYL